MAGFRKILGAGALLAAGFGASGFGWAGQPLYAGSHAGSHAAPDEQVIAITDAMIFDATGKDPFQGTIIIRDGRIADVGSDIHIPPGAKLIRAQGKALLPGFIDLHTHWGPNGSPGTLPQIASAYISSGVTTVNDFHQQPEAFEPRRNWLREIASPHVNFVARMSTPGGHGADWADVNTTKWVATASSARREVKALQAYRPDYIKVFADGWRYGIQPEETSMNLETLAAIVDEAHSNGQRVLTHTVTVERGKLAARAGVDIIAHSIQDAPFDAEAVSLIKNSGMFYAPTLAIYEVKPDTIENLGPDDSVTRQRIRKWGFAQANLRTLYEAGVPIAVGTDAGIGGAKHGYSTLRELELLVAAGLPPKAALLAGTSGSALALGLLADRGTIEKGKRADILLISGTPWENIADVHKINLTIIDGKIVYEDGVKPPAANLAPSLAPYLAPSLASTLIDDFERPDGRSALDTLLLSKMDGGVERSAVITNRIPRGSGGTALSIAVKMSPKEDPEGGVIIPLRRGSVQPVDARGFSGIELELRGAGRYRLIVNTLAGEWTANIDSTAQWEQIRIPFSSLTPTRQNHKAAPLWRGDDLLEIGITARRKAGESAQIEIDNIRFY